MSEAFGRKDAPLLVVMSHELSDNMQAWFWKVVSEECKILKSNIRIVYVLDEVPKGPGRKPKKDQLKQSWMRFQQEIEESRPKTVMPLGGTALYYLTGIKENIFDARGYLIDKKYYRNINWEIYEQIGEYKTSNKTRGVKKGDPKFKWVTKEFPGLLQNFNGLVVPSFDMDYLRLDAFACKSAFKEDVLRVGRSLDGTLEPVDKNFEYTTEAAGLNLALRHQWWDKIVAVDIETHGFDNEVIDRVSMSDGRITASLEWSQDAVLILNNLLSDPSVLLAFHNSPFDVPRLKANGVRFSEQIEQKQIFDTMFGAVTLQPDLHKGLGRAATVYLDCEPWKWRSLSEANPVFYSAKDAFITVLLAHKEIAVMKKLGVYDLFMGTGEHPGPGVMATLPVLTEMTRTGIKTNKEFAEWWVGKLERHLFRLEKLWTKMFPLLNPHSPKQIADLFYQEWKLPTQRSKKGAVSTDELALVRLKTYIEYDPTFDIDLPWRQDKRCTPRLFDLLLRLRDTAKTISTYVQPVAKGEVTWIHPHYLPISKDDEAGKSNDMDSKGNTSTGRLATYKPNIGNQPKKVRNLYVPDHEGMCFIQGDWKSAELVVLAHSAGDKRLIADLGSQDMHQSNANRFKISRDVAKNVMYASQYLAGPPKVSDMILKQEHLYVPVDECKRIMDGYKEYYSDLTAFRNYLVNLCETKQYIRNPFGRIRFFHSSNTPAAVNFWPQSITADCLWCILKPISEMAKSYGGRLTTTVYDSILLQVPSKMVLAASRDLKSLMERPFENVAKGFFLPSEIETGSPGVSWKELKKYA